MSWFALWTVKSRSLFDRLDSFSNCCCFMIMMLPVRRTSIDPPPKIVDL